MKYPQLVSTRAVNAISDWLVTRLEQLGVDAPLVYSRLLLSLLHTPLQINALDLAELSDCKIHNLIGGRKGSNRRLSSADTESLKRLAAIDSLNEAVAADQQLSHIEHLVDELCEKLREIERQSNNIDEQHYHLHMVANSTELDTMKKSTSPEDPTKRYYRAFPALSKDWNTEHIIHMKPKCLSWPSSGSSSYYINNNNNNNIYQNSKTTAGGGASDSGNGTSAGVKRKQKRRRNQAMSKGKSSAYGSGVGGSSNGNNFGNNRKASGLNCNVWDTDFEGTWEMGKDLIHEFVIKQNQRNRSISESDATRFGEFNDIVQQRNSGVTNACTNDGSMLIQNMLQASTLNNAKQDHRYMNSVFGSDTDTRQAGNDSCVDTTTLMIGQQMIRQQGYATPDTLTSLSEIETSLTVAPRRLYEREVSNESLNTAEEAMHMAMFEAKFDRNVEALWANGDSSSPQQPSVPPPANAPVSNVDSFWFNYYRHRYNSDEPSSVADSLSIYQNYASGNFVSDLNRLPMQPPHMSSLFDPNHPQHQQQQQQQQQLNLAHQRRADAFDAVHLTSSIWSENVPSEDDVSFYSNAIWSTAAAAAEKVVQSSQMDHNSNTNITACAADPNRYTTGYDMSTLSKWSDCTFETPFIPMTASNSAISTLSASNSLATLTMDNATAANVVFNEDQIRKNLYENSYFYDFKSLPVMSNFKQSEAKGGVGNIDVVCADRGRMGGDGGGGGGDGESGAVPQILLSRTSTNLSNYQNNVNNGNDVVLAEERGQPANTVVSLPNHSQTSGFVVVMPGSMVAPYTSTNFVSGDSTATPTAAAPPGKAAHREQKYPRCMQSPASKAEEENLLTSERTHFRPIKQSATYIDGHTFEIPSDLDEVQFERSASGTIYLENVKYMEYSVGGRPADIITTTTVDRENESGSGSNDEAFVLKFCVKQNEKSCQTDEHVSDEYTLNVSQRSYGMGTGLNFEPLFPVDIEMDYELDRSFGGPATTIVAITQDTIAATGPPAQQHQLYKTANILDVDQWTQRTATMTCANNNNTPHTLWEHCTACNCDVVVSMPASRLLKDELCADGDELMSKLKRMQNLYIDSEDDEHTDNEEEEQNVDEDDGEEAAYEAKFMPANISNQRAAVEAAFGYPSDVGIDQTDIFYNVNRLISEFLKPERASAFAITTSSPGKATQAMNIFEEIKSVVVAMPAAATGCVSNSSSNNNMTTIGNSNRNTLGGERNGANHHLQQQNTNISERYIGGLWGNNDGGIWRKEGSPAASTVVPTDAIASIWSTTVSSNVTADQTISADNWEHSNLEHIWNEATEQADPYRHIYDDHTEHSGTSTAATEEVSFDISDEQLSKILDITQPTLGDFEKLDNENYNNNNRYNKNYELKRPMGMANGIDYYSKNNNNRQNVSKRCDRKRRHSASQNVSEAIEAIAGEYAERKLSSMYSDSLNVTTIITCKYWTIDDGGGGYVLNDDHRKPFDLRNNRNDGNIDMNPSATILKQMAMMSSRPLTR